MSKYFYLFVSFIMMIVSISSAVQQDSTALIIGMVISSVTLTVYDIIDRLDKINQQIHDKDKKNN